MRAKKSQQRFHEIQKEFAERDRERTRQGVREARENEFGVVRGQPRVERSGCDLGSRQESIFGRGCEPKVIVYAILNFD
jgi:hypothetical protein